MEEPADATMDSVDQDQTPTSTQFPEQQNDEQNPMEFPVVSARSSQQSPTPQVDKDTKPGSIPRMEYSRGTRHRAARISVLVVLPVSLFAGVGIFLLVGGHGYSSSGVGQEARTVIGSISTAHRLMGFINSSANPCEDFYNFACGSWMSSVVLRSDQDRVSYAERIDESINNQIRDLLQNPVSNKDPEFAKLVKHIYSLCNNEVRLMERGAEPFWGLLSSIGYFPMFDRSWNESKFELGPMLTRLAKLDIYPLFELSVDVDRTNSSARRIYINIPNLTTITHNLTLFREWLEYGFGSLQHWGKDTFYKQRIHTESAGIISLFSDLYQEITNDKIYKSKNSSGVYQNMTLADMDRIYNWLNWTQLFVNMTSDPALSHLKVNRNEQVVVTCGQYLLNLPKVMRPARKRELANYLMTSIVPMSTYLGQRWYNVHEFWELKHGSVVVEVRWLECTRMLTQFFPESISRMYVDKYLKKPIIKDVEDMFRNLKGAFQQSLTENDWLSQDGKQQLLDKLKGMSAKIGYPSYLMDDDRLEQSFLMEEENEYFEVMVKLRKLEFIKKMRSLRHTGKEQRNKNRLVTAVSLDIVNYLLDNEIIIPLALIQDPYYEEDWSNSMKYGTMGSQIGGNIIAGFHNPDLHDNDLGVIALNLTQDHEQYQKRVKCYVLQNNNFTFPNQQVAGHAALASSIQDSGGLRQSYRAYRNLIKSIGSEEPPLLGLEFTHDQVFFLSFAQFWCEQFHHSPQDKDLHNHTLPGLIRILRTLQNSKEFADAFKCPPNSRINPVNKCFLW